MARLSMIPEADLTPLQAEVHVEALRGPRGKIPGPMIAWLRSPEIARHAQKLGAQLRFGSGLDPRLRELAILVCARHWTSHYEWTSHKRIALAEGLDPAVILAVARDDTPPEDGSELALVWRLSRAILRSGRLDEASYAEGRAVLGEEGMVELVATIGYYCLVALTLNVFELGLPEAFAAELVEARQNPVS